MTEVATSSAEATASTTTSKEEVSKEVSLLANGKRNLLCGEVTTAVNQLQEACRLLAAKYGDLDDRCGEAYLCYGSALLDLSRMESGVLGNALQGIDGDEEEASDKDDKVEDPEKCTGEEREKVSNEVIDAMLETDEELAARQKKDGTEEKKDEKSEEKKDEKAEEKKDEKAEEKKDEKAEEKKDEKAEEKKDDKAEEKKDEKSEETEKTENKAETVEKTEKAADKEEAMDTDDAKKDEKKEGDAEEGDEEGDTAEEGEGEEVETEEGDTAEEGEGEEAKKEKEDEDVSNLQLAWEILELAKVIYNKHDSKEMKLKAAEAYLKLGEVGLETEQYEQAIGDLRECLKLQQEHLEPESRLIAETHYQIGLACSFSTHHDDALKEFRLAVKTIETKIAKLTAVIEAAEGKGKEPASFDDPIVQAQKEVKDLKEILPDILAKIEDTEDEKRNQDRVKELVKENVASDLGTTTFGEAKSETTKMDTKDITHLVRKKRKPESESEVDDSKKAKTENGSGDSAVNGSSESVTNGKAETNGQEAPTATA